MRVIAGYLRGHTFDSPSGHRTHPMSEKIRGAIFNALGDLRGLTVLDAYAGSGALGFEALSRSAKRVTAIDVDKNAYDVIIRNARSLNMTKRMKLIRANAASWSANNASERFDVVLLDPPYDNIQAPHLIQLTRHAKAGGVIVCSLPPITDFSLPESEYELLSRKEYGDAAVVFYRRIA